MKRKQRYLSMCTLNKMIIIIILHILGEGLLDCLRNGSTQDSPLMPLLPDTCFRPKDSHSP